MYRMATALGLWSPVSSQILGSTSPVSSWFLMNAATACSSSNSCAHCMNSRMNSRIA